MSDTTHGFDACLFHPNFGNEVVEGKISIDRWALRFKSDALTEEIPVGQVVIELEKDGDRIYFTDAARPELKLYTTDRLLLECWSHAPCDPIRRQVRAITGRRELARAVRITGIFLIASVLLAWAGTRVTGAMVRSLVNRLPPEWERRFGDEQMSKLSQRFEFIEDTNQIAQLTALAAPLTRAVSDGNTEFRFHIMLMPIPNAFALPGGHVIVTTGLLGMDNPPEELLGVLAHEISHVTLKHGFRKVISAMGPVLICRVFLGSRNGVLDMLGRSSSLLVNQSFSQEYEMEADSQGWEYLVAANINPRGMISIFQKLEGVARDASYPLPQAFSSHPSFHRRIARLEVKWVKLPQKSGFLELTNRIPVLNYPSAGQQRRGTTRGFP